MADPSIQPKEFVVLARQLGLDRLTPLTVREFGYLLEAVTRVESERASVGHEGESIIADYFAFEAAARGPEKSIMTNDILGVHELAQLAGISPRTMSAYVARGQCPDPDYRLQCGPVWRLETAAAWVAKREKRRLLIGSEA